MWFWMLHRIAKSLCKALHIEVRFGLILALFVAPVGFAQTVPQPTYTPILSWSAAGGSAGAYITGWDGTVGNDMLNEIRYSTDISGPFGSGMTAKNQLRLTDKVQFGGYLLMNRAFVAGTDLWLRMYVYFPSDFCFSYGSNGDGWGATKWFRVQSTAGRSTIELGSGGGSLSNANYAFKAGPTCGSTIGMFGDINEMGAATSPFPKWTPELGGKAIQRGVWQALQVQWHFGDGASGFIRGWIDDVYLGQSNHTTLPAGARVTDLVLGDYWNGGFPKDQAFYIDEIVVSTQAPNTVDSGGRPFISPKTRVADFGDVVPPLPPSNVVVD